MSGRRGARGHVTAREAAEVHLTTWIARGLRRRIRVRCVEAGISLHAFVAAALREKLARAAGPPPPRGAARTWRAGGPLARGRARRYNGSP
jgi:hypothetical protein